MNKPTIYCSDPYAQSAEDYFNEEYSNCTYVEDLKKLIDGLTAQYVEEIMIKNVSN